MINLSAFFVCYIYLFIIIYYLFIFLKRELIETILAADKSGRLMKYDPITKKTTVLLRGLTFANGVALSKDSSFLLLAESSPKKILRLWLQGPKADILELFSQLERAPDNIKTNVKGEFWIGLHRDASQSLQGRNKLLEGQVVNQGMIALNSGKKSLQALQGEIKLESQLVMNPWLSIDPVGIKLDEEGRTLQVLDGHGRNEFSSVSEVLEHNGSLWIGSLQKNYVGVIRA